MKPKHLDGSRTEQWRDDPVLFCKEVLGYAPWDRQEELLQAFVANDYVAVRSGHKCSKSRSIASLALWWVATRRNGKVIFTAPSNHQVVNIVWPEFRKLYKEARTPLGGHLYLDSHKGLKYDDGREAYGVTTDKVERMAGISGAETLILVDEASGYHEHLFVALFGNLAGGGKLGLFGNPTQTSGTYFDAFHSKRANWKTLHIASTETPNFRGGHVPGLANPKWVAWAKEQWGEGTPMYDVRVNGNFPAAGENTVISLALLEAALYRWESTPAEGRLEFGVDPARFGDDESVIVARRGKKVLGVWAHHNQDGPALALKVMELVGTLRDGREMPVVKIDPIGVGASPADALRGFEQIELVEVDAGAASTTHDYNRMRDELWFGVKTWLSDGGALPKDDRLEGELVAPTYGLDPRNRIKVESKDDLRKRLKRSPDRADALALAVFETEPVVTHFPRPHISHFEEQGIG